MLVVLESEEKKREVAIDNVVNWDREYAETKPH